MMRGGNRQMRRMMDKMGLDMNDIPNVQEVIKDKQKRNHNTKTLCNGNERQR